MTRRGLSVEGLKADLVNRLQARLDEEEFGMADAPVDLPVVPAAAAAAAAAATVDDDVDEEEEIPAVADAAEMEETKPEEEAEPEEDGANPPEEDEAAAPPVTTTDTPSSADPKASDTFLDKKKSRAARFGIPVVEKKAPPPKAGKKDAPKTKEAPKKKPDTKKQEPAKGKADPKRKSDGGETETSMKKTKTTPVVVEEKLLPKAEIEKRIQRAQKFGTGNKEELDKLKSQLRKHRFNASGE